MQDGDGNCYLDEVISQFPCIGPTHIYTKTHCAKLQIGGVGLRISAPAVANLSCASSVAMRAVDDCASQRVVQLENSDVLWWMVQRYHSTTKITILHLARLQVYCSSVLTRTLQNWRTQRGAREVQKICIVCLQNIAYSPSPALMFIKSKIYTGKR